jgi:nicotinamidase-related amidase
MTASHDLHGACPDSCRVALLIIDMINQLDFADADQLRPQAEAAAPRIAALAGRARAAGIPIIYVNDNFGRWRSDFQATLEHVVNDTPGRALAEALRPHETDYFVLKPKHSGFFATALDVLLRYLDVRWLILTGISGDICVLFTAHDAYMRDYGLVVPEDCTASVDPRANEHALEMMRATLRADTTPSDQLELERYLDPEHRSPREQGDP